MMCMLVSLRLKEQKNTPLRSEFCLKETLKIKNIERKSSRSISGCFSIHRFSLSKETFVQIKDNVILVTLY